LWLSDILAEWDYPRSGLHLLEGSVTYPGQDMPKAEIWSSEDQEKYIISWYYSAQLYLRTKLNSIHTNVYGGQRTFFPVHYSRNNANDKQYQQKIHKGSQSSFGSKQRT
jgi:hypothetical protein